MRIVHDRKLAATRFTSRRKIRDVHYYAFECTQSFVVNGRKKRGSTKVCVISSILMIVYCVLYDMREDNFSHDID